MIETKDRKYFCKWGFLDTKNVGFDFFKTADKYPAHMTFNKGVGYSDQDILRIEKLEVNDSLDLSDGFMDHFITREK
jgi:hypothetical protein